jgi:hypothetical protein
MNEMKIFKTQMKSIWLVNIFAVVVLTVLIGCSDLLYGRLASNSEVTETFQTYQFLPDHTYYYRGTFSRPFVIAGINKNFVLDSPLWVEIDPNSQDFNTLIDRISLQGTGSTTQPWGFNILDKDGDYVGVWYSAIRAAAVDIDRNGRIIKLAPIRTTTIGGQEP